ncbi:MAG: TRAM domain-containing protein [Thermostichales cyanobacterium SZTDM-1c_bins_54]
MFDSLVVIIFMLAGAGLGFYGLDFLPAATLQHANVEGARFVTGGFGLLSGLALGSLMRWLYHRFEANVRALSPDALVTRSVGLVIGLVIANLCMTPVYLLPLPKALDFIEPLTAVFLSLVFSYLGTTVADTHGHSLIRLFNPNYGLQAAMIAEGSMNPAVVKVLDTSSLIDGRVLTLLEKNFLEGRLLVPKFVLAELQTIADKADPQKRERGRLGLDRVQRLRDLYPDRLLIQDVQYGDLTSVDDKLIRLAQTLGGMLVTTDYNLKKVAAVQGIPVLNLNELAEALRPVYLPGDSLSLKITREGKEPGQGVGYLEDGTMVVVEDGSDFIGKKRDIIVTSALQTPAGRMIFAKLQTPAPPAKVSSSS